MAYLYTKNEEDALDVVQDVAYNAFKNIHTMQNPAYFKTWVIRITINCSLAYLKKIKHAVEYTEQLFNEKAEEQSNRDSSFELQDLIDRLDASEKSVVLLKYYQSYSFPEIAELLDIQLGTAKTLLYRALRKLKVAMEEEVTEHGR
jgi:RNA polymerase sigma-70 factor (ECF subfamily)